LEPYHVGKGLESVETLVKDRRIRLGQQGFRAKEVVKGLRCGVSGIVFDGLVAKKSCNMSRISKIYSENKKNRFAPL
jgi:hypothetical protein